MIDLTQLITDGRQNETSWITPIYRLFSTIYDHVDPIIERIKLEGKRLRLYINIIKLGHLKYFGIFCRGSEVHSRMLLHHGTYQDARHD